MEQVRIFLTRPAAKEFNGYDDDDDDDDDNNNNNLFAELHQRIVMCVPIPSLLQCTSRIRYN
jgi:hypothetical protein